MDDLNKGHPYLQAQKGTIGGFRALALILALWFRLVRRRWFMEVTAEARAVAGFKFAGVAAGLKADPTRKDLGLIVADAPVAAAGVFTTNQVKAAPVTLALQRLRAGRLHAIAANSGSANCFTGKA